MHHTRSTLVKVVHEEYALHHTHAAGVLELAYTGIKLYTRARSGCPSLYKSRYESVLSTYCFMISKRNIFDHNHKLFLSEKLMVDGYCWRTL